jgi:transcriptional regulator with XRE-family HTH domain
MAKNFLDLHNARTAETRARVEARVQRALAEMPIQEHRAARHLSQKQLANILHIEPASISQLGKTTSTSDYLRRANWYEGRECEQFDEYKRILNQEGFRLSNTIEQFLKSFGGLRVEHPHAKVRGAMDYFHFDVEKAVQGTDPDWVKEDYSERTGEPLCIIGEAFREDVGDCVLAIIGIHPKMDMPEADIKHYLVNETKKEGVEMNKDHIKTTPIPDSDYAFTVSTL